MTDEQFSAHELLRHQLARVDPGHPAAHNEAIPVGDWFVHAGVFYFIGCAADPSVRYEPAAAHLARVTAALAQP